MRFSLAIVAAAANAAVLELDSYSQAVLELGSFNEAISSANAAEAATETEKWEALVEALYDPFQTAKQNVMRIIGTDASHGTKKKAIEFAMDAADYFSDPSKSRDFRPYTVESYYGNVADIYTYCSLIGKAPKAPKFISANH